MTWYEYRRFIELGGYGEYGGPKPDWWSEEGWKYRNNPPCSGGYEHLAVTHPAFMADPRPDFAEAIPVPVLWKGPWSQIDGMTSPPDDHPVFGLSWYEAEAYCNFVGGRLPTEAEWEVAATWNPENGKPTQYPWGNLNLFTFDSVLNNSGDDPKYPGYQTSPVGMYPGGKSHFGCYDMAGNVYEWCEDWSSRESYQHHSPECGADLTTPDFLKIDNPVFSPAIPITGQSPDSKRLAAGVTTPVSTTLSPNGRELAATITIPTRCSGISVTVSVSYGNATHRASPKLRRSVLRTRAEPIHPRPRSLPRTSQLPPPISL